MNHASGLDLETTKHDKAKNSAIGPNRIFSPVLVPARIAKVLNAKKAVIIQDKILINGVTAASPASPARRRIMKAKRPIKPAETMLAILKEFVNTGSLPPQAIVTGNIPAARRICRKTIKTNNAVANFVALITNLDLEEKFNVIAPC